MSAASPAPAETPENSDSDVLPEIYWKQWGTKLIEAEYGEEFHTVPDQDKEPHIFSQNCACNPSYRGEKQAFSGNEYPLYRHNSYDLREIDEWFYYNIQCPELGQTNKDMI